MSLRRLHRHLALLDGGSGHDPRLKLTRPIVIRVRKLHLRLRLRDQAPSLVDRRVGAPGRRVVFGQQRVELAAIEAGEHLALPHMIAVLGVELDDRQPVDAGRHLRFLARNQGARDEQAVDEFAFCRGNDGDRRRLDHARLIERSLRLGAGQAAALAGAILAISAEGRAQGATALAAQTPASAKAAAATTIRARRIVGPPRLARSGPGTARRRTAP